MTAVTTHDHTSAVARHASFDPNDFDTPTGREEDWRFTPLRRLRGLTTDEAAPGVFGIDVTAPEGVRIETVGREDSRLGRAGAPADRAAALAFASADQATVVTVAQEAAVVDPVWIRVHGSASDVVTSGHLLIDVQPFATATVVIQRTGSALLRDNVEVLVGDGASLTIISVQDWADDTVHLGYQRHVVGRDASLTSIVVTLGGDVVRLAPTVSYAAPGGDAELLGLFFADGGQHLEHRLFVDHGPPHCRSSVVYKGALQGSEGNVAHTVWIGDVLIRAGAVGTDTYEINRNLVLTDHARADSVPNLEIETGEVAGAGHASATGRFDDEQLFYLQARGIPEEEARRLVVRGFFAEVLQRIEIPALRDQLLERIDAELEGGRA